MNIGTVGEYSGLAGAALLNGVKSVQAWVQSVNAKGGIQCHPVKYIVADDGGDPAKNQTATHNLVERDNVVAMVNADAPLAGPASVQYLTQKGIPTIGGSGVDPWFYDSPMFFPQASEPNAGWLAAYSALGSYAKSLGSKNVALVYCVETPICAAVGQLAKTAAPKVGVTMAYVTQTTVVQPDYTSVCLNAQKSNAPVLWYVLDANSGIRLARSCDSVGYHPKYFAIAIHTAPSMAGMPSFDGLGSVSFVLPWMVTSNPSIATYHAVMKQYGAGVEPDGVGVSGWTSAMLFQAAVTHTQLSNTPTSQDILNGLYALNKDDLGGLTYPITFKKGEKPPQVACGWFVSLKNGRWISPNGTKPVICE
jgi:branched-chain amino acid transport system substrate-binding protein